MKQFKIIILSVFIGICSCNNQSVEDNNTQDASQKMLKHIVLFKFNDDLSAEQLKEIEETFAALPSQITEIKTFEWGTEINLERNFSHCFTLGFESEADLEVYAVHPAHKSLGEMVSGKTKAVSIVDYWEK